MIEWVTEICAHEGNVYTREVGPNDTTVYADWVYKRIPWRDGKPDQEAIDAEMARAVPFEKAGWEDHLAKIGESYD